MFGGESGYCTPEPIAAEVYQPGSEGLPDDLGNTGVATSEPATNVDVANNKNCDIGLGTSTPTTPTPVATQHPQDIQNTTTGLRYARCTISNDNVVNTGRVDNANRLHRQLVARVNYLTHEARRGSVDVREISSIKTDVASLDSELRYVKGLLTTLVGDVCTVKMILSAQSVDVKSVVDVIRELHNIGAVDWSATGRAILDLKETLRR